MHQAEPQGVPHGRQQGDTGESPHRRVGNGAETDGRDGRIDPIFVLLTVGLANASFCRLFGGDWIAMSIVFTSTLVGFAAKQRMQAHGVNHFLIFIISAFMASLCASAALRFDCSAETALATSVLFLVPGVPLINGVIDIVEGHILIGCSRLINALLLIICIAIGLSATLLMVKDGLL